MTKFKKYWICVLLVLIVCTLISCSTDDSTEKTFVIAYLPNEGDESMSAIRDGFEVALEKCLNVNVEEFKTTDYIAAVEALRVGKADMALLGAMNIVQADLRTDVEPIVMVAEGGVKETSGYKSLLIVNSKDETIKSIKDIKDKRIAFVDPNSASGNIIPSAEIIKAFPELELTYDELHIDSSFFSSVIYSGKHLAGVQAVVFGDVDVAPCASDTYFNAIKNGTIDEREVKIIHESILIPSSAMVVRSDIDEEIKKKLIDFLLKYDDKKYFGEFLWDETARFVECSMEDYAEFKVLIEKLKN